MGRSHAACARIVARSSPVTETLRLLEAVFGLCLRTTPAPDTSTQVELTETIPRRCTSRLRSAHTSPTRSPVWSEIHAAMRIEPILSSRSSLSVYSALVFSLTWHLFQPICESWWRISSTRAPMLLGNRIGHMMDRFSRDAFDAPIYKRELAKHGVRLVSALEAIPDSPEGIIYEKLLEGIAACESAKTSVRTKRGMT